ncbi:MAG: exodeoxyribonuclease VII large subunit [Methylococcaceae bacterium]|nr:exodeoxyribonuclease VII large subunit [Methylococcaceae bacterium]
MTAEHEFPNPGAGDSEHLEIFTVARLNREVRSLLADHFFSIWVEGEISNLAFPSSGHLYFTLKDEQAQVRCAMFRTHRRQLTFRPQDGCRVLVKAQVSLYEIRGDYQLIVEIMEESGDGALRRAFEALKTRLSEEGLFDPARKIPVPKFPERIGVITSPSGAALRDILTVLKRRFPAIPVVIYPVTVQGGAAKYEIAAAIAKADSRRECSVLLLARGGGSLEDLWAFNEEIVARAISRCSLPLITGIGHETDFTIADFVSDLRAATPSAAAETASPEQIEWMRHFVRLEERIRQNMHIRFGNQNKTLQWLIRRLKQLHPGRRLQDQAQRMDELELRLVRSMKNKISHLEARIETHSLRIHACNPKRLIKILGSRQEQLSQRLTTGMRRTMEGKNQNLAGLSHALETVSPLMTLSRGYAITSRQDDGAILRSSKETRVGEIVETRLSEGRLICSVTATRES